MSLNEIKEKYHQGLITLMEYVFKSKKFKKELDELYPYDISLSGKAYLFLNNANIEVAYCSTSNKERTYSGIVKGYRKFCGNIGSCLCNAKEKQEFWKTADKAQMTEKRKNTVKKLYGVDHISQLQEIKDKAAKTCFERYGTKSPTQNPEILKKLSQTCLVNNGVEWPQQNKEICQKTTQTFLERYGVDRPAKSQIVKETTKETCLQRYGTEHPLQNPEIYNKAKYTRKNNMLVKLLKSRTEITPLFTREQYATSKSEDLLLWKCNNCGNEFFEAFRNANNRICPECNPTHMSWGETVIKSWLDELSIEYEYGTYKLISPYQLDFYIPSLKLAIEFNGLYWHSELAGRDRNYHKNKFKKCDEQGITLLQVFEQDLLLKENIVKARILNAIQKIPNRLFARKLKVITVNNQVAKMFFDTNHLQGGINSKFNYGLVDNEDQLYAVMGFSKTRFSKDYEYEITRFSVKNGYSIPGAASKLFSAFVKEHSPLSVVSYADLNWGKGKMYLKLGFEFSHYTAPNYWYFRSLNEIYSRVKFQKHKLPKELHHLGSEWDIMKHLKWNRYWDSGNAVYVWKK